MNEPSRMIDFWFAEQAGFSSSDIIIFSITGLFASIIIDTLARRTIRIVLH